MKKLSLKESKKRCIELWRWLADNPEMRKSQWTEWECNGGKYPIVTNKCFACEYSLSLPTVYSADGINCNKCFLLNLWFRDKIPKNIAKIIREGYTPCEDAQYSAFRLWRKHYHGGNIKKVSFYARQIADYCKKHLKK